MTLLYSVWKKAPMTSWIYLNLSIRYAKKLSGRYQWKELTAGGRREGEKKECVGMRGRISKEILIYGEWRNVLIRIDTKVKVKSEKENGGQNLFLPSRETAIKIDM